MDRGKESSCSTAPLCFWPSKFVDISRITIFAQSSVCITTLKWLWTNREYCGVTLRTRFLLSFSDECLLHTVCPKIDTHIQRRRTQSLPGSSSCPTKPALSCHHPQFSPQLQHQMSDSELEDKVFSLFKDFMAGIAKFEELVPMGSTFLNGFQHALEVQSCQLGLHDHIRKGKCILNELECLLEDVRGAMQDISLFQDDNLGERLNEQACINDKEDFALPCPRINEVSDYAVLMAVIYSMVTQEYMMQEKVVSALSLKLSSGELDSYCLMWSLRPYIDEEIMGNAWKLIR